MIVAEHRLYYLVPYADRIIYMKHGSIVREFTGAEFQKLSPDELQGIGAAGAGSIPSASRGLAQAFRPATKYQRVPVLL